ncbi:hypothetical protein GF360_00360 [candidate division WWE3 bacterium]|nr:hypothetical protein [candidate division WWE3 bacterium]
MNPATNKTLQKILIPLLIATILSINKILNIQSAQQVMRVFVRIFVITSVIFVGIKLVPQIFNHIVND